MTDTQTAQTEQVARRYFEAWTTRDSETTASLLTENFVFKGGGMAVEGREAFLDTCVVAADADVTLVAEAYQGGIGFQMYDIARGAQSVRIVELLTVRDGVIVSSTFQTDMAAYTAFMTPGTAMNYNDEVEDQRW